MPPCAHAPPACRHACRLLGRDDDADDDNDDDSKGHGLALRHPLSGAYCIGPRLEGRIVNAQEEAADV